MLEPEFLRVRSQAPNYHRSGSSQSSCADAKTWEKYSTDKFMPKPAIYKWQLAILIYEILISATCFMETAVSAQKRGAG